jgi:hypothetical protein
MIKIADNAIQLLAGDGTISNFDSEWLQRGIVSAFRHSGVQDEWMAEDIALAVEYAIQHDKRPNNLFSERELNAAVVHALHNSGFIDAAKIYSEQNICFESLLSAENAAISSLLEQHLGISTTTAKVLAGQVINAAKKINITTASPTLFLELAKHLRHREVSNLHCPEPSITQINRKAPWLLNRNELLSSLKPESKLLIDNNVITFAGISRLFPALKITFMLSNLVTYCKLESPLTEMALSGHWHLPAAVINDIANTATTILGQQQLPLFINIPDMSTFACTHLQAMWPEASKDCREMLGQLEKLLSFQPFKIQMS